MGVCVPVGVKVMALPHRFLAAWGGAIAPIESAPIVRQGVDSGHIMLSQSI